MIRVLIRVKQLQNLRLMLDEKVESSHNLMSFQQSYMPWENLFSRGFSRVSVKPEKLGRKGLLGSDLMRKLERALKERRLDEAWDAYKEFRSLYGFPGQSHVFDLITELSYSADSKCLRRAFHLTLSVLSEKSVSLSLALMTKLVLSSARAQIPVQTSCILRLMSERKSLPSLDVLQMVFLHLVKTQIGTYLASNMLVEICDCFQNSDKFGQKEFTRPDVTIFNLVLDGCVRFGLPLKGQQIIELIPQVRVVADAQTVLIIACIHELNGTRDELKKFKDYIDPFLANWAHLYHQFYDCLLSLYFKFDDIDAASLLLLDICRLCESNVIQKNQTERQKPCMVSIGSDSIKMGLRLQFLPLQVTKDILCTVDKKQEFIMHKNGKLFLGNKGLAKLIIGYKRSGRISELSKLLIDIQSILCYPETITFCSDVIGSCIQLGWVEIAHDILEDLEAHKLFVSESSYIALLAAYCGKDMFREAEGLARRLMIVHPDVNIPHGMDFTLNCSTFKELTTLYLQKGNPICKSNLAESISQNISQEDKSVAPIVYEYNSSIFFFTKAKMIEDAVGVYRKMQSMEISPTVPIFFHLISGYSSLGMYREITILWGDIKKSMVHQKILHNRDLYELLLVNFIRGGYFERVMEVIGFMMKNSMYLDKYSYKTEFLKFHRDLYRRLTSADARTEAQQRRIERVQAFRKWVGIG